MSQEVATQQGTAVEVALSPEEQALVAQQQGEFSGDSFQVPILKVGQPLTKEVTNGDADAGEFINTLTGDGLGNQIEFIVAYYQKGRAASDPETRKYYVAFGDTIPEAWADLVGEEWVGQRFDEYPDAEEVYKKRANAKEIKWGKGPLVSTTHNYTGLAVVSPPEGSDEEEDLQPVRLTLKRTDVPAAKKINSLYNMSFGRNRPFYDKRFVLTTKAKEFTQGTAFLVQPTLGKDTTPDERQLASKLALATSGGRVTEAGDSDDAPVEPEAKGGAAI